MPRTHRLLAVRLCLLFLAAVLPSAIVLALAESADPSQAAAALPTTGLSVPAAQPVSKLWASHSEALSARQAECAAARASNHRRARAVCAVKKAKAKGTKPSASPRSPGTPPARSSAPAFAIVGPLPVEALAVPPAEPTPPAESPGDSDKPPVELPIETPVTGKASTTTTLSSSPDPSMAGRAVTYTATVSAIAATGSITFEDAGTAIAGCADQSVSSGAATCTLLGYAEVGTHSIIATYNGDSDYIGSTSSALNQVVSRTNTSTTLTIFGEPLNRSAARDLHCKGESCGSDGHGRVRRSWYADRWLHGTDHKLRHRDMHLLGLRCRRHPFDHGDVQWGRELSRVGIILLQVTRSTGKVRRTRPLRCRHH